MRTIIIFGLGMQAELLHFYIRQDWKENIAAFTVDRPYCREESFLGLPVIPFDEINNHFIAQESYFLVAIGYAHLNKLRTERAKALSTYGFTQLSYISPKATVASNTQYSDGIIIFENVTIQPFTFIGKNVTIWPNAFIGHHTTIQNGAFIGANAAINGHVTIGECSLIGSNAVIRENLTIGRESIVGAGSILLRSLPSRSVCNAGESRIYPLTQEKIEHLWPPKTSR